MTTRKNKPVAKTEKRGRGRPRKKDAATETVSVALSSELIAKLDGWCERAGKTRSTAIREFVEWALKGK